MKGLFLSISVHPDITVVVDWALITSFFPVNSLCNRIDYFTFLKTALLLKVVFVHACEHRHHEVTAVDGMLKFQI